MRCKNCKNKNSSDAKFCSKCGFTLKKLKGSVDTYFAKKYEGCQICESLAPTKYVEFYENMGFILMRQHKNIKGRLCKTCINKHFWEMTTKTLFLGWWGTISFLVTPFYLLNNIGRFIPTIGMKYK